MSFWFNLHDNQWTSLAAVSLTSLLNILSCCFMRNFVQPKTNFNRLCDSIFNLFECLSNYLAWMLFIKFLEIYPKRAENPTLFDPSLKVNILIKCQNSEFETDRKKSSSSVIDLLNKLHIPLNWSSHDAEKSMNLSTLMCLNFVCFKCATKSACLLRKTLFMLQQWKVFISFPNGWTSIRS